MLSVHLADHVRTSANKELVKRTYFIAPAAMWSMLTIREEIVFATVEYAVWCSCNSNAVGRRCSSPRESTKKHCDLEDTRETTEQGSRTACLQDDFMGKDEHARLRKKIGIDVLTFDDGQNFAVDEVKHALPDFGGHGLESIRFGTSLKSVGRGTEPYF